MRSWSVFSVFVVVIASMSMSMAACKREPAEVPRSVPASGTGPAVEAAVALKDRPNRELVRSVGPRPLGERLLAKNAKPQPAAPADLGDLRKFSGFSADESRYAFSVFSEGAGFHLLHVVNPAGETLQRFQLPDDAHVEKAREWLKAQGFSPRRGELPASVRERLKATVRNGKVVVTAAPAAGGEAKVLFQADPFAAQGGVGKPASAELAEVAPSGKHVAVKVSQTAVTEFGGITTYVIVDLTPALEGAK